jgi:hypothetical protein
MAVIRLNPLRITGDAIELFAHFDKIEKLPWPIPFLTQHNQRIT